MTNEELVERIQAGERELLLELWQQVERFVAMRARMRARALNGGGGVTVDDLIQSGYIAMLSAVDGFDPEQGMAFIGWLNLALKTAFAEAIGRRSRRQALDPLHRAGSLDAPVGDDEDGATVGDLQADPSADAGFAEAEARIWGEQLHAALEKALGRLPEDERTIIIIRFYQGKTVQEAGRILSMSKGTASSLERRALWSLRRSPACAGLRRFA